MLNFLKDTIARCEEKEAKLQSALINAETKEERQEISDAIAELRKEKASAVAKLDEQNKLDPKQIRGAGKVEDEDKLASMEYRTAFMNYVQSGKRADILKRADDQTEAADLGVLLPTTVVQEIMKGVEKVYGTIYNRVKHLNVKGGIKFPIGSFGAKFTRIGENGAPTDRQAAGGVTGYVEFSYNIGEIRLAQTLLQSVLTVPAFEAELAKVIIATYLEAMDNEILNGKAESMECEGILTEAAKEGSRIPAKNIITLTAEEAEDWTSWQKKLFAVIPLSMRKERPEFWMTANTWEANIVTLQDSVGQPVAREIYNPVTGDETCKFAGREVILIEEGLGIANFNDAAAGDVVGLYLVPQKGYAINSNMQFHVKRYFDDEKNQWVDKALVINDGRVLDGKYIYILKKGA